VPIDIRSRLRRKRPFRFRPADHDPIPLAGPIRGEPLGAEGLAERIRDVARGQRLVATPGALRSTPLLSRLEDSRRLLAHSRERIAGAAARDADIGPAGEWLLDNYYLVVEHVNEVRASLPRGYYRELPELAAGPLAGYPRVYELAITLISHTEGRIDYDTVVLVTRAFQEIAPLTMGELWAVPAMLRLGLLENVRRMTLRTVQRLDQVEAADAWVARIHAESQAGEGVGPALRDFITNHPPLTAIFVSRLLRQLRLVADGPFTPLLWLEQYLADEGLPADDAASRSADRLAITQLAMANSITSLRAITHMDWQAFVESLSHAEAVLRGDPSGHYAGMTFATRDRYRHVVERIAKRTRRPERAVAEDAVRLAEGGALERPDDARHAHVGYYLIDQGLLALEARTGYRPSWRERAHRWVLRHPNVIFVGGMAAGTVAAIAAVLWLGGEAARTAWLAVVLLTLIPANDIALSALNQLVTAILPPRTLPKLELRGDGVGEAAIPPSLRTVVVVPTLLPSIEAVEDALEHLEVQFLANREPNLHFALLSDFTDAEQETMEGDAAIIDAAVAGIRTLNERYAPGRQDEFYLFHRPRRWNPRQGVWMGWERKRGKLAEFNRALRHGDDALHAAFSTVVGDVAVLREARYVITLDSDTVLPPDAAPLLIGAMAHPLNRAVYDDAEGRVVRGYGILQPRVGVALPSAHRSRFASIHSGHPGVDPYTTAVSDVYQDLYGEGSYTGKGIYDVDAFERATHGRFPENTLLSHDLIEGNFARAGLVTEIEVYDDYPTRYLTFTRRKHRWIRGDWQLLRWLTRVVPGPDGPEPNRLSLLARWKVLDNLRRSTVDIAQLALLIGGWTVLPGSPLRWTILALLAIAAPWIVSLLLAAVRVPADKSWRAYYASVARDAGTSLQQAALAVLFLAHQAWVSVDAIVRTLWRLGVTQRNLLEWQTASHAEQALSGSTRATWRMMWPSVAIAVLALVLAVVRASDRGDWVELGIAVVPVVLAWIAAPGVAQILGKPVERPERRVAPGRRRDILRYALLHWRYFERFAAEDTRWLAPDNFQETPYPVVARRTSPTNIGLQLLATVSAHDLGFATPEATVERLERVFDTLDRLPRHHGHFLNWYELDDLQVLEPAYISTVDSGNLLGHLIALRQACLAMPDEPVFAERNWHAIDAALELADERLQSYERGPGSWAAADVARAAKAVRAARAALPPAAGQFDVGSRLEAVAAPLREVLASLGDGVPGAVGREETLLDWMAWTARFVAELQARVAGVPEGRVIGRRGEALVVFPSVREWTQHSSGAARLVERLDALARRVDDLAAGMDFRFLYDPDRKLFAIGYHCATSTLDASYYDLLASEARLASFVAVARNDVPMEHWFRLGRSLTHAAGQTALVSWSGSVFEYLMPLLVMRSFPSTLLDQTYGSAVRRHIAYGRERGTPWGVSESAYNIRDRHRIYQYRAFGVPDLALKRGLGRDLVVAPYATALAAMVDTPRACANLEILERLGTLGAYGFYDAVDYTRPEPGEKHALVRTYMAHHVGMTLVALTNALTGQRWQHRFHEDPMVRSAELLLHERIPRRLELQEPQRARSDEAQPNPELEQPAAREVDTPFTTQPRVALLGHLPYTLMVTNGGSGYSRYEGLAVTRWRADGTRDDSGQFCYVKDIRSGRAWSAAYQPTGAAADWYLAVLATDRVTFHRGDGDLETRTEIAVVPDDAAEVRRVTVTNHGEEPRDVEVTSYGEIVLAPPDADRAHPAFSNLFVETEWHEWCSAISATRRPRSASDRTLWAMHVLGAAGGDELRVGMPTCETDRARFVGRGRTTRDPSALERDGALSGSTGAVLDPIFAIRVRMRIPPKRSATASFTTLVAASRERAFELADRYHDPRAAQRALDLAWTSAQVELRELNITPSDAAIFQQLAGHLFFSNAALRAPESELRSNRGSQPQLWAHGLSGDWPILLATVDSPEGLPTLRQLLSAHQYLRRRGMMVDLVVLNMRATGYLQELHDAVSQIVLGSSESGVVDQPGGVFVRRLDAFGDADLRMLRATARVHLPCDGRALSRMLAAAVPAELPPEDRAPHPPPRMVVRGTPPSAQPVRRTPPGVATRGGAAVPASGAPSAADRRGGRPLTPAGGIPDKAAFRNGFGDLTPAGDYEMHLQGDAVPPAPWSNVIANPRGGFVVSERGTGFTWAENSHFFRLTPWANDPVADPACDAVYLRDEATGAYWSATPAPVVSGRPFVVRHAPGASTFLHERDGIASALRVGVPPDDPVRISLLRLTNHSPGARRLTVTAYAEWVLGVAREHAQHQVVTEYAEDARAILARNSFEPHFAHWVAFQAVSETVVGHTGDRREFLGRHGAPSAPIAMRRSALTGVTGAALDPCAVLRCSVELQPGETRDIVVLLGAGEGTIEARRMIDAYRDPVSARAALDDACARWERRLNTVHVRTPDPEFDAMLNRWTLYQALACRMWARSALYQSSGAFGFRDQLQDAMALVYAEPGLAREHIVRAAARQFLEGDVQHWWHPHSGRGVRTRFSDDLAWLPFVVDQYVRVTGDASVLDELVPFLSMRPLGPDEHELYDLPQVSDERAPVYEHCLRALRRACTRGAHGLPLIGIGDWNDGMSRVGIEGRGESVWLAWFLAATLRGFADHVEPRDLVLASDMRREAAAYAAAVEEHGWDGAWYRRAYFDDGTPLGSAENEECRIDSIAQSWSVISGMGDPSRQAVAMQSLEEHLVRDDVRLLMLLTPPFDRMAHDPGYIKGYLPGVRENGAQYTHAALWAVLATALRGDGDRAFELYQMINPLTHARTVDDVATYKVEPYVVAADVYTAPGQLGRGGWTWYTGSASWMYRVGLEAILGFIKRGDTLIIDPCVPGSWREYGIEYRYGGSVYAITVADPPGVARAGARVILDGIVLDGRVIPLADDGRRHEVLVKPED
jgi:cyclic beta-1,2-glucan synthetase